MIQDTIVNPKKFIFPYKSFNLGGLILLDKEYGVELAPIQEWNQFCKISAVAKHHNKEIIELKSN